MLNVIYTYYYNYYYYFHFMFGTRQFFQSYSRLRQKLLGIFGASYFTGRNPSCCPAMRNHAKTKTRHRPKQSAQFDIVCTSATSTDNNIYNDITITKQWCFAPKHVHGYPIGTKHSWFQQQIQQSIRET